VSVSQQPLQTASLFSELPKTEKWVAVPLTQRHEFCTGAPKYMWLLPLGIDDSHKSKQAWLMTNVAEIPKECTALADGDVQDSDKQIKSESGW